MMYSNLPRKDSTIQSTKTQTLPLPPTTTVKTTNCSPNSKQTMKTLTTTCQNQIQNSFTVWPLWRIQTTRTRIFETPCFKWSSRDKSTPKPIFKTFSSVSSGWTPRVITKLLFEPSWRFVKKRFPRRISTLTTTVLLSITKIDAFLVYSV